MLKRKPKVLTPEQMEEIRTKDFFDCTNPHCSERRVDDDDSGRRKQSL